MRFGRKSAADGAASPDETEQTPPGGDPTAASGPFDAAEIDLEEHEGLDLGGLVVTPDENTEVQLQVDEDSGEVMAVLIVGEDGGLELRAFAASRGGGAWEELRPRISSEMARRGGTATEQQGSFGPELLCLMPVETPEGVQATQPSRVIGYEGPNWLLRATLIGRPAVEAEVGSAWEDTIRRVVVRRGREAMAPGAPLPLTLPPQARRV